MKAHMELPMSTSADAARDIVHVRDLFCSLRDAVGVSQEEFANQLGVSPGRVAQVEIGHSPPSLFMLAKACRVAGGRLRINVDFSKET